MDNSTSQLQVNQGSTSNFKCLLKVWKENDVDLAELSNFWNRQTNSGFAPNIKYLSYLTFFLKTTFLNNPKNDGSETSYNKALTISILSQPVAETKWSND